MAAKKAQKKKYKLKKKKSSSKYNHEIVGIFLLAFGVLVLLSFYLKDSIGLFGSFIRELLLGLIGLPAFLIPPILIVYSAFIIFKKDTREFNLRVLYTAILLLFIASLIQTGYYKREDYINCTFFMYLIKFFEAGKSLKGGGILGGILSIPFLLTFQSLGTIIILTTLALADVILLTNISIANFMVNIKSLFDNVHRKKMMKDIENENTVRFEDINFEPDIIGEKDNLSLEFKSRPKVIDFKIERTSRELREKTASVKNKSGVFEGSIEKIEPLELQGKQYKNKLTPVIGIAAIDTRIHDKRESKYGYPPIDLLIDEGNVSVNIKAYKNKALEGAKKLEETLNSFGVTAKVINISRGPTVTRYELSPSAGVKVSKIVNLADDISLNLASSGVRIEAPIPGKAAIGIEVPNEEVTTVHLREVIESHEFNQHPSRLAFAIGKDISGECVVTDIAKMPHLLIAGATGAGKSVCINNLIISLVYKSSPQQVKLLMIDPKVVELGIYNGIPHLLIPVVTDPRKAAGALNWAVQEMINRYKLFADRAVRDLKGYNEILVRKGEEGILPEIVIIIDELADLMMVAPNDVEDAICRLAQMARAAGMHLVIATQRPSVDVITGVIKANIPSRISFAVSSQIDSRTILDMAGAEKLLGKGDMLFYPVGRPKPVRLQGAFVSEKEVEKVVEYLKSQGNAEYDCNIIEEINSENEPIENKPGDNDELLPRAVEMVIETGQASVSLIQRKFKVGYARAARIIDQMEERGIVGGFEGSKPRQILITRQQWYEMQITDNK